VTIADRLTHPWLTVRVQIALGAIFAAAALPKIADPPSFAHMIYNYRLAPGGLINAMALMMPWIEILSGIALITGIWRRTAATLIGALLVVFMIAIGINLSRDHAVSCGCFDLSATTRTHDQLIDDMRFVIVRDTGMLLMVGQILWSAARRSTLPAETPA
jgi:uncharacterized membrane protein YphA (DoxX/SURF4 family)